MQKEKSDLALLTKNFALQAISLFQKLPRTAEAQVLGKQLLRAATSVGANYREAYRGRSKAEFVEMRRLAA
jgi:four helix bundle protein